MSLPDLAREYADLEDRIATLESEVKALTVRRDEVEKDLLMAMANAELDTFKSATLGRTFIAGERKFPRLADKTREEEMHAWLVEQGYGAIVKPSVQSSTLRAALKEIAEKKVEMPPFIETYKETRISMRRNK
jgi:cell division protein FtsB